MRTIVPPAASASSSPTPSEVSAVRMSRNYLLHHTHRHAMKLLKYF